LDLFSSVEVVREGEREGNDPMKRTWDIKGRKEGSNCGRTRSWKGKGRRVSRVLVPFFLQGSLDDELPRSSSSCSLSWW
jgi:hypothetical protein